MFNDYDASNLKTWLDGHKFGEGRRDGQVHTSIDLVVTNYRIEHMSALLDTIFGPSKRPPVIYSTHACARGSLLQAVVDMPKELEYLNEARRVGVPAVDLCSLSHQARSEGYDVQARKQGRIGDPHLCMPGPHIDMMEFVFHMAVDLERTSHDDML